MRLTQIRDFVAVADAGSVSSAARSLGVSQPGLTKSIGSLETELGVALLRRSPRGVTLTKFGRAFYARAHAAQSELEQARQEVAQLAGGRGGQVAVGFGPMAAALVLPPAVAEFRARFPQVEVRLLEGFAHAVMPLVRDHTLDMALGPRLPGYRHDATLKFRPVFHNEQIVVGRKGHPLTRAGSISDLSDAHWLSFEPRPVVDRVLTGLGLSGARQLMQCESLNVLVALLASSDMLAVASSRILGLAVSGKSLQQIPIRERIAPMTTGLFVRAETPLTPPAAAMAKLLVEFGRKLAAV
jgi:LysR family transcriptional regulator, regulator of abg operon